MISSADPSTQKKADSATATPTMNINFMVAADSKYFHMLRENCAHIKAIYPDGRIFVFDYGLEAAQRSDLETNWRNILVIDWTKELDDLGPMLKSTPPEQVRNLAFAVTSRRTGIRKRITKMMLKRFPGSWISRKAETDGLRFEYMLIQKIRCMRHASDLCAGEPLLFLDADAILFRPIDELFGAEMDVSVTIMDDVHHSWEPNRCMILNTGVIAFGPNTKARNAFLDAWWSETLHIWEWLREQTALVRYLERVFSRALFTPYGSGTLAVGGVDVRIRVVPCAVYNFGWTEHGVISTFPEAKVFHFVNKAQDKRRFAEQLAELEARFWLPPEPGPTPAT